MAIDQSGNLYVAANLNTSTSEIYEILVYAAGATGAATPVRTLTGVSELITSIGVDATGQIYTVSSAAPPLHPAINIYASNATGNATPIRQITGDNTNINPWVDLYTIDLDGVGNIYLTEDNLVSTFVFSSTATGNTAPMRTVATGHNSMTTAVTVDASGNIYYVISDMLDSEVLVLVYPPSANGTVSATPSRTITFLTTGLTPSGAAVDAVGNLYIQMSARSSLFQTAVYVFSPIESGVSTPTQVITSSAITYPATPGIAVY